MSQFSLYSGKHYFQILKEFEKAFVCVLSSFYTFGNA